MYHVYMCVCIYIYIYIQANPGRRASGGRRAGASARTQKPRSTPNAIGGMRFPIGKSRKDRILGFLSEG